MHLSFYSVVIRMSNASEFFFGDVHVGVIKRDVLFISKLARVKVLSVTPSLCLSPVLISWGEVVESSFIVKQLSAWISYSWNIQRVISILCAFMIRSTWWNIYILILELGVFILQKLSLLILLLLSEIEQQLLLPIIFSAH